MLVLNILIVLWLTIVVRGYFYSRRLVRRAHDAKAWLKANGYNGYREVVANGAIHRGRVRVFIFGCMVLMGVNAGANQFFPAGSEIRQVLSGAFRLLFIVMAVAFTYKSYLEEHELDQLQSEDQKRKARAKMYEVADG